MAHNHRYQNQHQYQYQHPPPSHGPNYSQPAFAAELDASGTANSRPSGAPSVADGGPIFEMPADSAAPVKQENSKPPSPTPSPDLPVQANPWPFYLENPGFESRPAEGRQDSSTGSGGKAGDDDDDEKGDVKPVQANPWPWHGPRADKDGDEDGHKTSATVDGRSSNQSLVGQDATPSSQDGHAHANTDHGQPNQPISQDEAAPRILHGTRPQASSPSSPTPDGETASLFPAPLKISHSRPTSKLASPPTFKPYSPPPESDVRPAPLTGSHAGGPHPGTSTASLPYRPYRPSSPSPGESPSDVHAPLATRLSTSPPPGPCYQAYSVGAAPHHFYTSPQTGPPSFGPPSTNVASHPPTTTTAPPPAPLPQPPHAVPHSPPPPAQTPTASLNAPSLGSPPSPSQQQHPHPVASPPPPAAPQSPLDSAVPFPQPQYAAPFVGQQHQPPKAPSPVARIESPASPPPTNPSPVSHASPSTSPAAHGFAQPSQGPSAITSGISAYNIPQKTYASAPSPSPTSSQSQHAAEQAPSQPQPSAPTPHQSPQPPPLSPPPPYSPTALPRPGSQPPAVGHASPYLPPPPPPPPLSQLPPPAPQLQYPTQPTYAPANGHRPSGQLSLHGLHPPPLPPRPVSANSNQPFGHPAAYNPAAFPPPPRPYYSPPSALPPPALPSRPGVPGVGKLFNSSSAKKWLDKTNQVLESRLAPILQGAPDMRYRAASFSGGSSQRAAASQHRPPHLAPQYRAGAGGSASGSHPNGSG